MALTALPLAGEIVSAAKWQALFNERTPLLARKTVTETVSNNTIQNDDELVLAVEANAVYFGRIHLVYSSSTVADFKTQLSMPSGATAPNWTYLSEPGSTLLTGLTATNASLSSGNLGTGADDVLDLWGLLITSSTAGNVNVQWAQQTTEATSTSVKAGSFFMLVRTA